ncbi:MAG: TonB-dependent receptor [Deltaproteobacteria bacterium]|nr:TonB-dependent receptor [Deltaproteobacteria bacterium]
MRSKWQWMIVVLCSIMALFGSFSQVFAEEEEEREAVELKEVVVTATRDWVEEWKVPYNVSMITEEDIKRSNAQNVADLLRTVPGVFVSDWTANRKSVTVDIRGFGETGPLNSLVLVDGRRVNQIDISGTDWTQIPLDQVERIEVIRGGGSVLYGDNAVGGVVNIVTKKGKGKPSVQAEALGGSYGLNIQRASSRGALGDFRYAAHARHENTRGFRHNGGYEGYDFGASVGYDIGDIIKLDIDSNYHYDTYGLPGPLSYQDLHTWADSNDTKEPDNEGETEDYFVRFSGELDLKAWGRVILDTSYRERESKGDYVSWGGSSKYDIPTFGVTPRWVWEQEFFGFHNKLIAGFDYYHSNAETESRAPWGDPARGLLSDSTDIERDNWSIYFHDDFSVLKNLIFSFGYRYDEVTNDFEGSTYTGWPPAWVYLRDHKDEVMNAWEVGLTCLFVENSKVYGRIAKSYRYPAIDEYFSTWGGLNRLLEPQGGITYEVGVDHYFTDTIRSGLTFFWMELEDEIYYNPMARWDPIWLMWVGENQNYDKTRHWGIEFSAEGNPWNWLRLWANYTYIEATFREGVYEGNDVPSVPNHKVSFGFDITPDFIAFLKGLEFNVWATYVSEQRFISDQPNVVPKLDDYITVNAKLSYAWRFLTAFVGVNNIFDEEYSEYGVCNPTSGARNYYPSAGVNFSSGLSVKF